MTFNFQRLGTGLVLPAAASGLCLTLCLATSPAQALLVTTYNTGAMGPGPTPTTLPNGAIDPHFLLVGPIGSGTAPGIAIGSALVLAPAPAAWVTSLVSEWLAPQPPGLVPPGVQYYQTAFDLTGFNKNTALMAGQWATFLPSPSTNIFLNGISLVAPAVGGLAASSTFNQWAAFGGSGTTFTSALNPGMNYLTFGVPTSPAVGSTGLRVEYSIDALPVPEPSTWATFGLGLAAVGLARARRLAIAAGQAA